MKVCGCRGDVGGAESVDDDDDDEEEEEVVAAAAAAATAMEEQLRRGRLARRPHCSAAWERIMAMLA